MSRTAYAVVFPVLLASVGFHFSSWLLAAEKVKLATATGSVHYNIFVVAARDKGFFKEGGLELEYLPFRGGVEMNKAFAAGAVDTGVTGPVEVILSVARGLAQITVADLKQENAYSVYVPTNSPIRKPEELKGAKVGINRFGGTVHALGRYLGKTLNIEKDIKFMAGGGVREEVAALMAGTMDARVGGYFAMAPILYAGRVRELVRITDQVPQPWPHVVLFARKTDTDTKAAMIRGTIQALFKGARHLEKDPNWTLEAMKKEFGFPEGLARMIQPMLNYGKDWTISAKGIGNVRNFLIEYGLTPKEKTPPVEELYTNKFVS